MSYKISFQCKAKGSPRKKKGLQIPDKNKNLQAKLVRKLHVCYKDLSKQNRVGADLTWGSIVPPFFVPVSKGGILRVLQTAIIGEKNPAHLYTKIVNKVVSQ